MYHSGVRIPRMVFNSTRYQGGVGASIDPLATSPSTSAGPGGFTMPNFRSRSTSASSTASSTQHSLGRQPRFSAFAAPVQRNSPVGVVAPIQVVAPISPVVPVQPLIAAPAPMPILAPVQPLVAPAPPVGGQWVAFDPHGDEPVDATTTTIGALPTVPGGLVPRDLYNYMAPRAFLNDRTNVTAKSWMRQCLAWCKDHNIPSALQHVWSAQVVTALMPITPIERHYFSNTEDSWKNVAETKIKIFGHYYFRIKRNLFYRWAISSLASLVAAHYIARVRRPYLLFFKRFLPTPIWNHIIGCIRATAGGLTFAAAWRIMGVFLPFAKLDLSSPK